MSMIEAVRTVLRKYVDFTGRARLSEYWWWTLVHTGIIVILFALFMIIGYATADPVTEDPGPAAVVPLLLLLLFVLATLLPDLAVTVRRLHDSDRSGWWLLLSLEPTGIGGIVLLVFTLTAGTPGPNRHGPSPKGLGEGYPYPYPYPYPGPGVPGPYGTAPDHPALPPYGGPPQPYTPGGLPQPTTPAGPYAHQPYPAPSGNDTYQAPPAPSPSDTPSFSPPDTSSSSSSSSSSSDSSSSSSY